MRVLTPDGSYVQIRERSWPMAGLGQPQRYGGALGKIELVAGEGGALRAASYGDIYRSNPWVFAAVNLIAWGLSRLPLKVYELDDEGGRSHIRGDVPMTPGRYSAAQQIAKVLRKPEPRHGAPLVMRKVVTDILTRGNALQVKDGAASTLTALWHVPWKKVTVVEGETEPVLYFELGGWRGKKQLIPEDVVHIGMGNDPDSPVGLSPMRALKYTIALHNAIQRHMIAFFANQARASGNLHVDKGTSREVLEFIREQVQQLYAGAENAGKVIVSTGAWQSISESPEHSSIIELVKLSREEVAATYGVTPPLMGILDRAIMGNVRELRSHHTRELIGPWAVLIEGEYDAQLLSDSPSLQQNFLAYDLDEQLRPDFEARAKAMRDFQNTMTLNERRDVEKLPRIKNPDADAVFVPLNESPIGEGGGEPSDPDASAAGRQFVRIGPTAD